MMDKVLLPITGFFVSLHKIFFQKRKYHICVSNVICYLCLLSGKLQYGTSRRINDILFNLLVNTGGGGKFVAVTVSILLQSICINISGGTTTMSITIVEEVSYKMQELGFLAIYRFLGSWNTRNSATPQFYQSSTAWKN